MITDYISLIRPKHWIKNFLIFAPCLFGGVIFNSVILLRLLIGFFAFSLLASSIYIINDMKDVEKDRMHEVKKYRAIAAGKISMSAALIYAIGLVFAAEIVTFFLVEGNNRLLALLVVNAYFILNVLYSLKLKNQPIVDVMILAGGFVLRVIYGSIVSGCEISQWFLLTILMFSLYMGLGKRRNEIRKTQGNDTRTVLKYYTDDYLSRIMLLTMSMGLTFYSLWATFVVSNRSAFVWTIPLVISILMKYELDVEGSNYGDPVDVLVGDRVLQILVVVYIVAVFGIIYLVKG